MQQSLIMMLDEAIIMLCSEIAEQLIRQNISEAKRKMKLANKLFEIIKNV